MRPLYFLLVFLLVVSISCKDDNTVENNFDNTNLVMNEGAFFNVLSAGYNFTWSASSRSDYRYALKLIPITSNEESEITNLFINSPEGILENNLTTNSYELSEDLVPNSYYALMIVKYPMGVSFGEFINTVSDEDLRNYVDTWYYVSEGGDLLIIGCGNSRCGDGCSDGVCPDGTSIKCGCRNGEFCLGQLCLSKNTLSQMPFI